MNRERKSILTSLWNEACSDLFDKYNKLLKKKKWIASRIRNLNTKVRDIIINMYYHDCKMEYKVILKKISKERILSSLKEKTIHSQTKKQFIRKTSENTTINKKLLPDYEIKRRSSNISTADNIISSLIKYEWPAFKYIPTKTEVIAMILKAAENYELYV